MAILVDELRTYSARQIKPAARRYGSEWCHLTSDVGLRELHIFAAKLGLTTASFQAHPTHPHYDLTPHKREQALRLGARFVPAIQQARERRQPHQLALPGLHKQTSAR